MTNDLLQTGWADPNFRQKMTLWVAFQDEIFAGRWSSNSSK